jgi:hypothetical protein
MVVKLNKQNREFWLQQVSPDVMLSEAKHPGEHPVRPTARMLRFTQHDIGLPLLFDEIHHQGIACGILPYLIS